METVEQTTSGAQWLSGAHDSFSHFFEGVTPLTPWVLAFGMAIAFLLWMKGSKLLRPALTLTGAVLGAAAGGALATPIASTVVGLLGGALVGALAGYLSFRIVTAGVAGVACAAIALAGSVVYLDRHDRAIPIEARALNNSEEAVLNDAADLWRRTLKGEVAATEMRAESQSMIDGGAAAVLRDGVKARYEALPEQSKVFVSASTAVGAMFGILMGLIFPRGIAALSTAGLGAAGLVVGGLTLAIIVQTPGASHAAAEPARLLGPWAFLTLAGIWLQRSKSSVKIKQVVQTQSPAPPPCAPAAS
ncbi:MAG: hypothetical protein KF691_03225 [Phycisphaeraceae bacterium]|nr:hypothetical protein [Phycisphaeraceae bacterium]